MRSYVLAFVSLAVLRRTVAASAATTVGGQICSDAVWDLAGSPYVVTSSVEVCCNAMLTIEPGVQVRFEPDTELRVGCAVDSRGTLVARGSPQAKILFTSNRPFHDPPATPQPRDWVQIWFTDHAVDSVLNDADRSNIVYKSGSILEHCIVEYAGDYPSRAALFILHSRPFVSNCEIRHIGDNGIEVAATPPQRIQDCEVWDAHADGTIGPGKRANGGGIQLSSDYTSTQVHYLLRNWVHDCTASLGSLDGVGAGINVEQARVLIEDCVVEDNRGNAGGGIAVGFLSQGCVLRGNTIRGNSASRWGGGVYLFSGAVRLEGNVVEGNRAFLSGNGIYLESNGSTFVSNEVRNNTHTGTVSGGGLYLNVASATFEGCNRIFGNSGKEIVNARDSDLDLGCTWLGTCDPARIEEKVLDCRTNPALGCLENGSLSDGTCTCECPLCQAGRCEADGAECGLVSQLLNCIGWSVDAPEATGCRCADLHHDGIVDLLDVAAMQNTFEGR